MANNWGYYFDKFHSWFAFNHSSNLRRNYGPTLRSKWLLERSPLKRPGYPRELVGMCQLLASSAGSFITGQTMYVEADG